MQQATLAITLPAAPRQAIQQTKRIFVVSGSAADGSQDVAVDSTGPLTIKAGVGANVTVSVSEVLANGRQSAPATMEFVPSDHVEPVAADPAGFAVQVVLVDDIPDADQQSVMQAGPAKPLQV
jgi:hypothetical protein